MHKRNRMCRCLSILFFVFPLISFAAIPVKSIVIFGDSLSDIGNTTHLLKSLRQEEGAEFLVAPFKTFVINKMIEYANDYYVPQMVLDAGLFVVSDFFDNELGPYLANLIGKIRLVPILPGAPYWESRFSNGPVWDEYLADMLHVNKLDNEKFQNYAFGGSWASTYDHQLSVWNVIRHPLRTIKTLIVGKLIPPSLGLTVQSFLMEQQEVNDESLYFVYAGSNDYLNILVFESNYDPNVMSAHVDIVVSNLSSAVTRLIKAGARRFVIMGIPHIGDTPKYVKTTDRDILNFATDQHNARLEQQVDAWKMDYPDADFIFIDTNEYLQRALNDPLKYGYTNVEDACIDVKLPMFGKLLNSPFARNFVLEYAQVLQYHDRRLGKGEKNYHVCDNPQERLFWDEIHPSTRTHAFLAMELCGVLKEHGYDVLCTPPDVIA